MKRSVKAYFTLEAVLVLPLVLGVIGVVLFLLAYQYDRLVLEQDMGMLSVRISSFDVSWDETGQEFARLQQGLAREKYLLGTWKAPELDVSPGRVSVSGQLQLPLWMWGPMLGKPEGGISTSYRNHKLSPLFVIRSCERVKNDWEEGEN